MLLLHGMKSFILKLDKGYDIYNFMRFSILPVKREITQTFLRSAARLVFGLV